MHLQNRTNIKDRLDSQLQGCSVNEMALVVPVVSIFDLMKGQLLELVHSCQCVINRQSNKIQLYFYRIYWETMISSPVPINQSRSLLTPIVDQLLTQSRENLKSRAPHTSTEKDQINSIRKMADFLLAQEKPPLQHSSQLSTKTSNKIVGKNPQKARDYVESDKRKEKNSTYLKNKTQISHSSHLTQIVWISEENRQKKLKNSNFKQITGNATQHKRQNAIKPKNAKQCPPNSLLLKNCKQDEMVLNYTKHNTYLKSTANIKQLPQKEVDKLNPKPKRVATEEQINKIFEGVNNRGHELREKKQAKVKKMIQQKKKQQLKGFTFTPNMHSSRNLKSNDTKDFLERMKDHEELRERKLASILSKQLKKATFKPTINQHKSSHSTSKVDSFRSDGLPYFNVQSKPQSDFQQMLSRLSSSKNSVRSLTKSSVNHDLSIPAKPNEFNFLFQ